MAEFTLAMLCTLATLHGSGANSRDSVSAATQPAHEQGEFRALMHESAFYVSVVDKDHVVASHTNGASTLWSVDPEPKLYGMLTGTATVSKDCNRLAVLESANDVTLRRFPELDVIARLHSDAAISGVAGVTESPDRVYWWTANAIYRANMERGKPTQIERIAHFGEATIESASVSPKGRYVAAVLSNEQSVHIMDSRAKYADDVREVASVLITSVTFSGDGDNASAIAIGIPVMAPCDVVTVLDLSAAKSKCVLYSGSNGSLAVAVSPDEKLFATNHRDGITRVWNLNTHKVIAELHTGFGTAIGFAADCKYLIVATENGSLVKAPLPDSDGAAAQ